MVILVVVNKPLYENVGIGTIIKRIGECTALTSDYNMSILLTQQTPKEDECKDLCITVGSKIVVIDFKAPDQITHSGRVYRNVKTRIKGLEYLLGSDNLLLGLLHATLRVTPQTGRTSGYFLHIATPMFTVFVPLSQFTKYAQISSLTVKLGDIIIRDVEYSCFPCEGILYDIMSSERNLILSASIPSCYYYRNSIFNINRLCSCYFIISRLRWFACIESVCSECCLSCGGLCNVILYGNISRHHASEVPIRGYTLASLLWMMRCCELGYYVKSKRERDKILEYLSSNILGTRYREGEGYEYIYLISYTPGIGFQMVPLSTFIS